MRDHPLKNIIGDLSARVQTRTFRQQVEESDYETLISQVESKNIDEALSDEHWVSAMHEELHQFERNNVWSLVSRSENQLVISTKWIFRNKLSDTDVIVRNKVRLVAKRYTQEFGVDFEESYAPVARIEAIKILLAYACLMQIKLFQIDVKSIF